MRDLVDLLPLTDGVVTVDRLRLSDEAEHKAGAPKQSDLVWWPSQPGADALHEWFVENERAWEDRGSQRFLATRVAGRLVGGLEIRFLTASRVEVAYWTLPEFRKRGYARRSLQLVVDILGRCGPRTAQLRVEASNAASLAVAERVGFEVRETQGEMRLSSDSTTMPTLSIR